MSQLGSEAIETDQSFRKCAYVSEVRYDTEMLLPIRRVEIVGTRP